MPSIGVNTICAETESESEDVVMAAGVSSPENSLSAPPTGKDKEENGKEEEGSVSAAMQEIRSERGQLETFLFNENNKISKMAIKYILAKWSILESKLETEIMENRKLQVELECNRKTTARPAFSEVVRDRRAPAPGPVSGAVLRKGKKKGEVLLIKPMEENDSKTNEEIRENMVNALGGRKSKLRVRSCRPMRGKGLVLTVESDKAVRDARLKEAGLRVAEPQKADPYLVMYDVGEEYGMSELLEDLVEKNCGDDAKVKNKWKDGIKFKRKYKSRNGLVNWIIQAPYSIQRSLVEVGRVFLQWKAYKIEEYINIIRCFKCHGYGHIARHCIAPKKLCVVCGEPDHLKEECKRSEPSCINCVRTNQVETRHDLRSKECREYIRQVELYKDRINIYG